MNQVKFAQDFIDGALRAHIRDEVRLMFDNDDEGLFDGVRYDDLAVDINVTVRDASILVPWSILLNAWAKRDHEGFMNFEEYHTTYGFDLNPYKRLIKIHSINEDTNALFFDAMIGAASSIVQISEDFSVDQIDICEDGVRVSI